VEDTVDFSIASTGTTPIGHRWRRNASTVTPQLVPNGSFTITPTSSVFTITGAQLTNAGTYTSVASNITGTQVLSGNAYLVVVDPPTNQAGALGSTVTLRATVGAPPNNFRTGYEWQFNGAPVAAGTNSTILFTSELVLTNLSEAAVGTYTFLITNFLGAPAAFTARVSVGSGVEPIPVEISLEGTNAVVSWPDAAGNWGLEEALDLTAPSWKPSEAVPVLQNGRWRAEVPVSSRTNTFLRLRSP
jgi:hypothetical protein